MQDIAVPHRHRPLFIHSDFEVVRPLVREDRRFCHLIEPPRRTTPLRGEGGAGQPCRVAVVGNRSWLTGDGLVVGCLHYPPSRSHSSICRAYRSHRWSPIAVLGRVRRTISPALTASAMCHISFSCCGRSSDSTLTARGGFSALRRSVSDSRVSPCTSKLPAQPSLVRSIHCGTAAVVLAVVVSSGTGGRRSCLRLLLLRQHLRFGDKPCQRSR